MEGELFLPGLMALIEISAAIAGEESDLAPTVYTLRDLLTYVPVQPLIYSVWLVRHQME